MAQVSSQQHKKRRQQLRDAQRRRRARLKEENKSFLQIILNEELVQLLRDYSARCDQPMHIAAAELLHNRLRQLLKADKPLLERLTADQVSYGHSAGRVQDKAEFPCRTRFSFGISANGQKLYIWGASFDMEVYDSRTLKRERTISVAADLFYELDNKDGALRIGERVGVILPLRGEAEGLVVPRSALFLDYNGGEWVYEVVGEHAYARRRVEVDRILGNAAALTRGPGPGAKVVTTGVAELAGAEFGYAK